MIECPLAELTDEEVSAVTGRRFGARRARAEMMLGERTDLCMPLTQLREQLLENADYRWRKAVQRAASRTGWHYWTDGEETTLAAG